MVLPQELISHIGSFLSITDRKTCLQTSSIFSSICFVYTYHEIVLNGLTIYNKMPHLIRTLKYIKRIKPLIELVVIKFEGLTDYNSHEDLSVIFEVFPVANIEIHISMCSMSSCDAILASLPTDAKVVFTTRAFYVPPNRNCFIKYNCWVNDDNVHILRQPNIAQCATLRVVPYCKNQVVDFSLVDVNKNKELEVVIAADHNRFIDLWKVTSYNEVTRGIYASFLKSLLIDPKFDKTRLQKIGIMYNYSIIRDDIFDVVRALPKTVYYYLSPVNPDIFAFIDTMKQCGACNFRYLCDFEEIQLSSLMCQRFQEYNFPIISSMGLIIDDNIQHMTVHEIYQRMHRQLKQNWHIVYKMLSKEDCP